MWMCVPSMTNVSKDTWNRSHGVELLLLAICFRLRWHLDPVPHTQHQCLSHRSDGTACCWLINTDHFSHYALEASSCVETQNHADTLARRVLETLFSAKRIQCPVPLLRPAQNMNCRWNRNFLYTKSSLYSSKGCVPLSSPRPTSQRHVCRRHVWRCVGRNYAVYAIFGGGAAPSHCGKWHLQNAVLVQVSSVQWHAKPKMCVSVPRLL